MEIDIPCDENGFVALQCQFCGEYFKLKGNEIEDEENLQIWCPYCGLIGEDYITEEVKENAIKMMNNYAMEMLYEEFKKIEKSTRSNKWIKFEVKDKPKEIFVDTLKPGIDRLEIKEYDCCKKQAKITPTAIEHGSYCPFCGGRNE